MLQAMVLTDAFFPRDCTRFISLRLNVKDLR